VRTRMLHVPPLSHLRGVDVFQKVPAPPELDVAWIDLDDLEKRVEGRLDFRDLKLSPGLSNGEAKLRLARDGKNALTPPKQRPEIIKYLILYLDPFMLLLNAAGILCFIAYGLDPTQILNLWVGVVLEAAVFLSSTFSYFTERRAGDTMKAFKKMLPRSAHVIREGARKTILADEVRKKEKKQRKAAHPA
jgi:magnesium-transporting ATPase (P-type)